MLATEQVAVRKTGTVYRVTLHVQADPMLSLHDAHVLSGMVKGAIRAAVPQVASVLVHMEPCETVALPRLRPIADDVANDVPA